MQYRVHKTINLKLKMVKLKQNLMNENWSGQSLGTLKQTPHNSSELTKNQKTSSSALNTKITSEPVAQNKHISRN